MSTTPDTGIGLVASQQEQPEVTHNEAVTLLAALSNGVIDIGRNSAPGSPTAGDSYIIGAAPTGTWSGKANKFVTYTSGGWRYFPDVDSAGSDIPMGTRHKGFTVWVRDDGSSPAGGSVYVWKGAAWAAVPGTRVED